MCACHGYSALSFPIPVHIFISLNFKRSRCRLVLLFLDSETNDRAVLYAAFTVLHILLWVFFMSFKNVLFEVPYSLVQNCDLCNFIAGGNYSLAKTVFDVAL